MDLHKQNAASFKNIPKDLGCNFYSLFSSKNLKPFLIGVGITASMSFLDENELDDESDIFFHQHETNEGSTLGEVGEEMGNHIILPSVIGGLAVTGQFIDNQLSGKNIPAFL